MAAGRGEGVEVVAVTSGGTEKLSGGVQASAGDWTKVERRLVGMGRAIFCSLCLASAACTASVWMSDR